jgi:hypothetical protein
MKQISTKSKIRQLKSTNVESGIYGVDANKPGIVTVKSRSDIATKVKHIN